MKLTKRVLKPLKIFKGFDEGRRVRIENEIGESIYIPKKYFCKKRILVMIKHEKNELETTTLTHFLERRLTTEHGETILISDCTLDLEGVEEWDMIEFDGYSVLHLSNDEIASKN